jgi:hypothetical protein
MIVKIAATPNTIANIKRNELPVEVGSFFSLQLPHQKVNPGHLEYLLQPHNFSNLYSEIF